MFDSPSSPIVVGIDGSKSALEAALWAADEAVIRGVAVHLLHVVDPDSPNLDHAMSHGRDALRAAADSLIYSAKPVTLTARTVCGDPLDILVTASRSAQLLCIGAKGTHNGNGGTAAQLARTAHCSVAIIRHTKTGHGRWVLATLQHGSGPDDVLDTAIDEAQLRDRVVLAITPTTHLDADHPGEIRAEMNRCADSMGKGIDDGVEIATVPRPDHVGAFLRSSTSADDLVVVSADERSLLDDLLGPAGSAALRTTNCSLLIRRNPQLAGHDRAVTTPVQS
ncbi:MAG: universal stress protein [Mycobacterium sp.]|nr:universal stress protein [Mycobacterium sp.]